MHHDSLLWSLRLMEDSRRAVVIVNVLLFSFCYYVFYSHEQFLFKILFHRLVLPIFSSVESLFFRIPRFIYLIRKSLVDGYSCCIGCRNNDFGHTHQNVLLGSVFWPYVCPFSLWQLTSHVNQDLRPNFLRSAYP